MKPFSKISHSRLSFPSQHVQIDLTTAQPQSCVDCTRITLFSLKRDHSSLSAFSPTYLPSHNSSPPKPPLDNFIHHQQPKSHQILTNTSLNPLASPHTFNSFNRPFSPPTKSIQSNPTKLKSLT